MTTQTDFDQMPTFTITDLIPLSSDPHEDFLHPVLEMFRPARRSSQQLQLSCHYTIFSQLQNATGSMTDIGRVRKTRITEPLDGVCEATVTVRFGDRLRVVAIRFEGLDGRWLCTCLALI